MRYQINVIASGVADVVQSAGGWMFDRGMAGWDVNVLVADRSDVRPLEILGARTLDVRAGLASISRGSERAAGLPVAADLLATDERVHGEIRETLRSGITEVALWGDRRPVKLGDTLKLSSID